MNWLNNIKNAEGGRIQWTFVPHPAVKLVAFVQSSAARQVATMLHAGCRHSTVTTRAAYIAIWTLNSWGTRRRNTHIFDTTMPMSKSYAVTYKSRSRDRRESTLQMCKIWNSLISSSPISSETYSLDKLIDFYVFKLAVFCLNPKTTGPRITTAHSYVCNV